MVRACVWIAGLALVGATAGCVARHSGPPTEPACTAADARPPGLLVAGTGSALPLARALADRWRRAHPESRVHVPDSIGTGGAMRALADGAIDVGLASRKLTDKEAEGVRVLPLARSIFHLASHPRGAPRALSRTAILDVFTGRMRAWPDGTPIVPLLREPGDSGYAVIASAWPELHAAMLEALHGDRFTVCYTDQEMRDALAETEGAIGLLDSGIAREQGPPLTVIELDAVAPAANGARGPFTKLLTIVLRKHATDEAERFAEFARAKDQADLLATGGYLTVDGAP